MQFKKYLKRYKFKFLYSIFLSNFYQHNSNIIQNTSRVLNLLLLVTITVIYSLYISFFIIKSIQYYQLYYLLLKYLIEDYCHFEYNINA